MFTIIIPVGYPDQSLVLASTQKSYTQINGSFPIEQALSKKIQGAKDSSVKGRGRNRSLELKTYMQSYKESIA